MTQDYVPNAFTWA